VRAASAQLVIDKQAEPAAAPDPAT